MSSYVVGAAILSGGRVLAQQRGYPPADAGRWELPGGRVEPGEDDRAALARECLEELGVNVVVGQRVGPEVMLRPGLVLRIYQAFLNDGTPHPHDHQALQWIGLSDVDALDWLPADRAVLPWLRALLASTPN
jgi:8-oxo-dGTP diphosphatase